MKELKLNNKASKGAPSGELAKLQKSILMQASLALLTIVLTVVILFAVTSAWYTNIVQTGGLVFNVESWGFKGEVIIDETPITVAPGDSGAIYLTAQNENEDIIELNVNVQKTKFHSEMQKRLFFYVDAQTTRNGETMERVYVNSEEDYTYTLFGKGSLTLTEDVANAPRLKWHWVYDLLGYYVLGTQLEDGTVKVKEYLRPIEYDLDSATFSIVGEDGDLQVELITVDGTTTVAQFLTELSEKDGYEGTLSFEEGTAANAGVYYEISAPDSDGCGIYAYLCTYSEIETATDWDTETGELAYTAANNPESTEIDTSQIIHEADINISAQKSYIEPTAVSSAEDLQNAIDSGNTAVLSLENDISITKMLTIPEGSDVTIDLNGKTITREENTTSIEAKPGSSLTFINTSEERGKIVSTAQNATNAAIRTIGAELNMNGIDIEGFGYGVFVGDSLNNNTADSTVRMVDCKITNVPVCAVFIYGNGAASEQKTQIVIESCTLESDGIVLCGNGSTSATDARWGTDIQVLNSTLISNSLEGGAAVYHPQKNSTLTIYKSTLSGYTGVVVKGGSVNIINSTVTGNGETANPAAFTGSGFADTADAIYIETNYGFPISVEIDCGTNMVTSINGKSLQVYEESASQVKINIISGIFDENLPEKYINSNSTQTIDESGTSIVSVNASTTE